MKKRGVYQRAKERQNKLSNIFLIVIAVLVTLLLLWGIVESAATVHNIDKNTYQTYSGEFTYRIVKGYGRHSNITYRFTLTNGDEIAVRAAMIDNKQEDEMEHSGQLIFRYSTFPISLYGTYSVIAISSLDGSTVYLDAQNTKSDDIGQIWVLSIILAVWLALCGVVVVIAFLLRPKRKK